MPDKSWILDIVTIYHLCVHVCLWNCRVLVDKIRCVIFGGDLYITTKLFVRCFYVSLCLSEKPANDHQIIRRDITLVSSCKRFSGLSSSAFPSSNVGFCQFLDRTQDVRTFNDKRDKRKYTHTHIYVCICVIPHKHIYSSSSYKQIRENFWYVKISWF